MALTVALSLRSHRSAAFPLAALRATQPLNHVRQCGVPSYQLCERLWLSGSHVAALTVENQNVLAKVVRKFDDMRRRSRGIIAREVIVRRCGPSIQCSVLGTAVYGGRDSEARSRTEVASGLDRLRYVPGRSNPNSAAAARTVSHASRPFATVLTTNDIPLSRVISLSLLG